MRKTIFTALMLGAPRAALACPVCFGQSDSPLALAANTGILVMLGLTAGVLAVFAALLVRLMRRSEQAVREFDASLAEPREGTAPC